MRLFEGKEVEGQFKGLWTLFVEGIVPTKKILETVSAEIDCLGGYQQIYFGAGWPISDIDKFILYRVGQQFKGIVTAQSYIPVISHDVFRDCEQFHIVLPLWHEHSQQTLDHYEYYGYDKRRIQVKFDSKFFTHVWRLDRSDHNLKTEVENDVTIWEG